MKTLLVAALFLVGCGDDFPLDEPATNAAALSTCGNGQVDTGEQCDDANQTSDDGCSATCQLEAGWSCPLPGRPCRKP